MDNITHALVGLVLGEATVAMRRARGQEPSLAFRAAASTVGIIAAELPDADLVYAGRVSGGGNLGYLLHHRGHTHTVVIAVLGAVLVWAIALGVARSLRARDDSRSLLALCLVGTLSHLALDWTNNYGVHPFWPLNDRWFYGDSVFIVEPWLWVVAIPPLVLLVRTAASRAVLALLLATILGAAWVMPMVERGVAVSLLLGTVVWSVIAWRTNARQRAALAVGGWLLVEATFIGASRVARASIREVLGSTLLDVSLTPAVGDPTCYTALVMERGGGMYRLSSAAVAPWPSLRAAARCPATPRGLDAPTRPLTTAVAWNGSWSAPVAELAKIAREDCGMAVALRFMRVPAWIRHGPVVELWDVRFGRGGFAAVVSTPEPSRCPPNVPPWMPPRADLLR